MHYNLVAATICLLGLLISNCPTKGAKRQKSQHSDHLETGWPPLQSADLNWSEDRKQYALSAKAEIAISITLSFLYPQRGWLIFRHCHFPPASFFQWTKLFSRFLKQEFLSIKRISFGTQQSATPFQFCQCWQYYWSNCLSLWTVLSIHLCAYHL